MLSGVNFILFERIETSSAFELFAKNLFKSVWITKYTTMIKRIVNEARIAMLIDFGAIEKKSDDFIIFLSIFLIISPSKHPLSDFKSLFKNALTNGFKLIYKH